MALVNYNTTLSEWENIIRVQLKVANPALLKSGALGVLANYLAGIKYDSLQFYTKAFQEMNIGLAQDFNSMLYHSTIYGTELEYAVPATLNSSLVIPEIRLAEIDSLTYTIPRYNTFSDTNNKAFTYVSEIKVIIKGDTIKATSWSPAYGTRKLTVTKAPNPNVPGTYVFLVHNDQAQQYVREISSYIVPEYDIGDSFEFSVGIESITTVKDVLAWVNTGTKLNSFQLEQLKEMDPDNIEGSFFDEGARIEKIDIKFYKFDSSLRDKDLFLEIYENSLNFETGDGIHGAVMPKNAQIIVETDFTEGRNGNIPNSEYIINNIEVVEEYQNGVTSRSYDTNLNGLSTTGSHGGTDIQTIDGIRENIFNQINVRDSIITENDYERLFKYQDNKPFVDAKFLDAKAFVFLFNVIHDEDQVVPSTSVNYKESFLLENPFYPVYEYSGYSLISPFYYKHSDVNTIDAYIVNPNIPFTLDATAPYMDQQNIADYRVDLSLTYEFQRSQSGMNGKSYMEITEGMNPNYVYRVFVSWLGVGGYMELSSSNDFKYEISTLYTDPFCIVREETSGVVVQVFDPQNSGNPNGGLLAEFRDASSYHQLIKKQSFYKYFQELPLEVPQGITTTRDTIGYLDNYLAGVMSTVTDVVELNQEQETETYLLRLPFIDEDWFLGKKPQEIYEIMDDYFIADYVEEDINYNTQLTQSFHNTIDIPEEYYPYIFEENTMAIIDTPKLKVELELFLDRDTFIISEYESLSDFEIAIRIAVIKFLKEKEGFMIDFFDTDLEKYIYNTFSPIVKNINVVTPTLFRVQNSAMIYNNIQENLSFKEVLDFAPPYFYYDYDNMSIKIDM